MIWLILLGIIVAVVIYEAIQQGVRDKAAHVVLDSMNLTVMRSETMAIRQNTGFVSVEKNGNQCPFCGNNLVLKQGTTSQFLVCNNSQCKYTKNLSEKINKICPLCKNKLLVRKGKYGRFLGCSNYPRCRFTGKIK